MQSLVGSSIKRIILAKLFCLTLVTPTFAIAFDIPFATGGKYMTTFGSAAPSTAGAQVHLQSSGRIVTVGSHSQEGTEVRRQGIAILGLTSAGGADQTYGTSGKILIWSNDANRSHTSSTMLADGSLLIFYSYSLNPQTAKPVIEKYTAAGQPDQTFAANLEITPDLTRAVIFTTAADGKLLVVVSVQTQYHLIRLNSDGSRDATFGPNGVRTLNLNRFPGATIFGLHELPDGKLVVLGRNDGPDFYTVTFVARFTRDGNLDRTFGTQGVVRLRREYASAYSVTSVIQPDGKILIGGYETFLGSWAMLARLTTRGRPDVGFGTGGFARTAFRDWNGVHGISLTPTGKIVVAGSCGLKAAPTEQRLFVAIFSEAGVRESFMVTNFITNREAGASDVKVQPDGKFVIAAFTQNPADTLLQLAVARFVQ